MTSTDPKYDRRSFIAKSSLTLAAVAFRSAYSARKSIPTLGGKIHPGQLGTTLMHEHLLWFGGPMSENVNYVPIPDHLRSASVDYVVSLLNEAYRVGIRTLVDLTPFRPIDLYMQIARRSKVNIITSTGFYRQSKVPQWMAEMKDEKAMEELITKDITQGIEGTRFKAGMIKVAQEGSTLTPWEIKTFSAAAHVNKHHGTPITTHTGNAVEQFNLLIKEGANPNQIILSHVDVGRHGNPGVLINLAKQGSYLEVDTFGQDYYTPWEELVAFLRALCDAGLSNKIIISMDSNWHWEHETKIFEGSGPPNNDAYADRRTFSYMMTDAVPKLLKSGFSTKEVNTFLIDNPRNFFS